MSLLCVLYTSQKKHVQMCVCVCAQRVWLYACVYVCAECLPACVCVCGRLYVIIFVRHALNSPRMRKNFNGGRAGNHVKHMFARF